ncbi:sugar-binding domain-containing protein [Mucilaginibacter sp. AW1-3]
MNYLKYQFTTYFTRFIILVVLCFGVTILLSAFQKGEPNQISLAGEWRFQIDSLDKGVAEKWYNKVLKDHIHLPGSMTENLKGNDITLKTKWTGSIYDSSWYYNPRMAKYRQPGNIKIPFWLTPPKHYTGAAWYQKDVIVPAGWKGGTITLNLERVHTECTVWMDGIQMDMQNTMVVPQEFYLGTGIKSGKHTITLRIDNRIKDINVGQDSHSLTDHTQGNWNGVIGKMTIDKVSDIYFSDIQVYPDLKKKLAHITLAIRYENGKKPVVGKVILSAKSFNTAQPVQLPAITKNILLTEGKTELDVDIPMGNKMQTWDEFSPALYMLSAKLITPTVSNTKQVQFGMREFKAVGKQLQVNGRPVFLRGTVNNCEFPLTGYPAMDVAAWDRIFRICKEHGLNHMRFHSWCPPEAAFIAADKAGFYLHVEGPSWANHGTSIGDKKPIDQFIYDETNRMAKVYGNYASFCMMAYGNEPRGRQEEYLGKFVNYWKAKDSRRIYTGAAVGGSWPVIKENEYMARAGAVRGLTWKGLPESTDDFRGGIESFNVPFVVHEMGQWCVFPDFKEIKKYTGVYKAKNFELFQEDLADHNMGDQGEQFLMASGKLQALCYKMEIEKELRTPGMGGFQMLSLNDYPGQGTALVGVLSAFWDEKGYITPKQFSRFCNAVVPLARIPKFVYTNNETFTAGTELYNYGPTPLNAKTSWKIKDEQGKVLAEGETAAKEYVIGNCLPIGNISFALSGITKPSKLNLEVLVNGTSYANDWDFWVYPAQAETKKTDIYYTTALDKQAEDVLNAGGKVFLNAAGKVVKGKEVVEYFTPVFWNTSWFKMRPPHTLGIVCDPKSAAFADFPTDNHSDLQWFDILNKSQVMLLEDFPKGFKPIVQPIDTWFLNRRLALVFEAKVGKGKLIVSSANLAPEMEGNHPTAKQLYTSLQNYMASDKFNPAYNVDLATVKDIFETPTKEPFNTFTKDSPDELKPKPKKP